MARLRLFFGLFLLGLLAACDSGPAATATPPAVPTATAQAVVAPPTQAAATAVAVVPTVAPVTAPPTTGEVANQIPIATPAGTFVVPATAPSPTARLVALKGALNTAAPNIAQEVATFFDQFYQARTLAANSTSPADDYGLIILNSRDLTDEPYRDYTITLLQQDYDAVVSGDLLAILYNDVHTTLDEWKPGANGQGSALVTVTRTKQTARKGHAATTDRATLRFRLDRRPLPDNSVAWVAVDFYIAGLDRWVSQNVPPPSAQINSEIAAYFARFYAARTLAPGGKFDIETVRQLTAFEYQDYTIPLLERQQAEADGGQLRSVSYSDLKTEVVNWFPQATSHGGVALVNVTRTAHVVRPAGAEPPQTATYQFRLHRHWEAGAEGADNTESGLWLAYDFFSPATNAWVSNSGGVVGTLPAAGHG